ncbi:WAS/WASL-interacting protein family member 1-like [Manacus candei]|uniref:WAS/WASL-interacting protein family member 1-like n=1 Tax=Manacus candei TaxID=415023 RepID=UPI00222601C2|nr:WAS/WASL-interacting protein family member 1-like [Manacus candei]
MSCRVPSGVLHQAYPQKSLQLSPQVCPHARRGPRPPPTPPPGAGSAAPGPLRLQRQRRNTAEPPLRAGRGPRWAPPPPDPRTGQRSGEHREAKSIHIMDTPIRKTAWLLDNDQFLEKNGVATKSHVQGDPLPW